MKIDNHYTLTLITTTGEQVPIGIGGLPNFHVFKDWALAHGAIADVVATIGMERILTIAQTTVRRQGGHVDVNVTHLERNHIVELWGRSVCVSVPYDDEASPSDGQL